jgi:hypothetical protein
MAVALVGAAHSEKEGENMRDSQILVTALVLGILSAVPGIRAAEPSKVDLSNSPVTRTCGIE